MSSGRKFYSAVNLFEQKCGNNFVDSRRSRVVEINFSASFPVLGYWTWKRVGIIDVITCKIEGMMHWIVKMLKKEGKLNSRREAFNNFNFSFLTVTMFGEHHGLKYWWELKTWLEYFGVKNEEIDEKSLKAIVSLLRCVITEDSARNKSASQECYS